MSDFARAFDTIEPLLDSDQAAAILKIHPKSLQRYARSGLVVGLRVGKLWRFRASDLIPPFAGVQNPRLNGLDGNLRAR